MIRDEMRDVDATMPCTYDDASSVWIVCCVEERRDLCVCLQLPEKTPRQPSNENRDRDLFLQKGLTTCYLLSNAAVEEGWIDDDHDCKFCRQEVGKTEA